MSFCKAEIIALETNEVSGGDDDSILSDSDGGDLAVLRSRCRRKREEKGGGV